MNDLSDNMTVAEVVVRHPEVKPVLEVLGIDYCCGGDKKLADAAAEKDYAVSEVWSQIQRAVADQKSHEEKAWSSVSASELARHILDTHHVFMKRQLPRLAALFDKVVVAHGERHGDMLRAVQQEFQALKNEIDAHLMKEEQILFPYIVQLDTCLREGGSRPISHCGTVQNPIRQMKHEHENAGRALARMRELTSDYALPEDACASFEALYDGLGQIEADLHEHIHLENNILFPEAVQIEEQVVAGA